MVSKKIKLIIIIHLFLILFHNESFSQNSKPQPPNGIELSPNLFIDKTEISNINWLEYLFYLKRDSSNITYVRALPDTSVWLSLGDTTRWKYYLREPSYTNHPVVGVSHQQAIDYCHWRSTAVNSMVRKEHPETKFQYYFRLPAESEWMAAAYGKLNPTEFPYGHERIRGTSSLKLRDSKKYYEKANTTKTYNDFRLEVKKFINEKNEPVFNVMKTFKEYFPYGTYAPINVSDKKGPVNTLGLHHMIGNVAEMVLENNVSKGGSWFHFLEESDIQSRQRYNAPSAWLGFRCVCEVTESGN